jgi:thiosulfate/3-mercaptopyruvate sulfurtransferase
VSNPTEADPGFKDADWLIARRGDPRLRVVDARSVPHGGTVAMPSGSEQYAAGHLPGAVHLDYADDLRDPATPYATRVAPADFFARVMGAHGIGNDAIVVAYDSGTIPFAARLVWMLRYYGHAEAYVLAGGIEAWKAAGEPLSTETPEIVPATFDAHELPRLRATRAEVESIAAGMLDEQLVETQRDQTYAQRDRGIPGSVRLSGNLLLEDARGGRVADRATLDRLVASARLDPHKRTVVTCGSGVSASGAWLALRAAGFDDVAVYDGSWLEWEHDQLPTVPKPAAG